MEERNDDKMPVCPFLGEPAPAWMDGLTWEEGLGQTFYDPEWRKSRVLVDTGVNGAFPDVAGVKMVTGRVYLSVVAGDRMYSIPSVSGIPWCEYTDVEVGIIVSRILARPEAVGLGRPWTDRFEPGNNPVLPRLPVEQVPLLVNDIINAAQKEG